MNENNQNDSQKQIHLILGALIILSGIVAAYLYVQSRHLRADVNAYRPIHTITMQNFNLEKQAVDAFLAKLAEYGRTNPDFVPILKKYGIPLATNTVASTSAPAAKLPVSPATTLSKPAQSPTPAPKK